MIHTLKCWPEYFYVVWDGDKRHEIRKADRPYAVGDKLQLREYDPDTQRYSGRWVQVLVTYLTAAGTWGLPADLCVMSIEVRERHLAIEGTVWEIE